MARTDMNTEYFSGSQASIFIGDVWVDEIIDWQCSYGANAQPIYGYGDTFFSHAAQGRVLVQGSFTVNFKEPNYLFAILARYQKYHKLKLDPKASNKNKVKDPNRSQQGVLDENYNQVAIGNPYASPEKLEELGYVDKRNALQDFFDNGNKSTVAEKLIRNSTLSTLDPRLVNEFAIPLFDIKIGYGTVLDQDTIGEQIVGIKLVGKGKTIMANGEPIKESYSFFAKNLV
jgi:hypothetical protein